jgi:hypothetical protein
MGAVRSDIRNNKAVKWLVDHVGVVDEEGQPVDRAQLLATEAVSAGGEPPAGSPSAMGEPETVESNA